MSERLRHRFEARFTLWFGFIFGLALGLSNHGYWWVWAAFGFFMFLVICAVTIFEGFREAVGSEPAGGESDG